MAEHVVAVQDAIVGTWRLVSWQTHDADGTVAEPFGADAIGMLSYTGDGYLLGQMMRADRPAFSRPRRHAVDLAAGDPAEVVAAFNSFLAYAGRWSIGHDGLVHHHVEVASIPGWAGTTLTRDATFVGEHMVLRTRPRTINGIEQRGVLRWTRA